MTRVPESSAAAALVFDDALTAADAPARCEPWRREFDRSADWVDRSDVQPLRGAALEAQCRTYGFPGPAVQQLLDHRESWDEPRIRRLGAHVQWMVAERYSASGYQRLGWPAAFSACPLFYAYAALGLARRVAAEQAARHIDAGITRATLWDIGQQVLLHHRVHQVAGMNKGWWLSHHLSHHLFRLGRLQFQRGRSEQAQGPVAPGEAFLDVHIPEDGALDASACDAAFAHAAGFFAHHYPDDGARWHVCTSWLLDPALCGLLPAASNILRFRRRFELHDVRDGPSSVFEFVFDRPDLDRAAVPDLSTLRRDTALRCAIVDHYRQGGVIRRGVGAIPVRPARSTAT